jgi:hypothetical protein
MLLSRLVHPNSKQSTPQAYTESFNPIKFQWPITPQNEASKPDTDGLVQPLANRMTAYQQVALCRACLQIVKPS